jgi:hypothetical protein
MLGDGDLIASLVAVDGRLELELEVETGLDQYFDPLMRNYSIILPSQRVLCLIAVVCQRPLARLWEVYKRPCIGFLFEMDFTTTVPSASPQPRCTPNTATLSVIHMVYFENLLHVFWS